MVAWSMIAWRQAARSPPVERSISVSAPYFCAHSSFSTSSAVPLVTGEAPMLALILVVIMRPMPVGSRRLGARSPRSTLGSLITSQRCATVWFTHRRASAAAPGWPTAPAGSVRSRAFAGGGATSRQPRRDPRSPSPALPLVGRRRQLFPVPVAHLAAGHAARARGGIEHLVHPATEGAVVPEHDLRVGPDTPQVVVRRIDLGGERAGVEAPLRGQHREAAHAAGAEAVELGLAVAVVLERRARAGVEEHLVALEDAARVRRGPRLETGLRMRRQRLRVAPMVDGVVEHRLAPQVALQDVDQALGLDAVREDGDQAAEAALAHVADRPLDLLGVERRLAAVELQVAVGGEGREGLVEDGGRVALVPALGRAVDRAPGAGPVAEVPFVEVQLAQLGVALGEVLDRLVEEDRPQVRRPRRVVQAPVVDVVDDLVVGDPLEGDAGVPGDEAEHAAAVLLGRAGLAREVPS